MNRVYVAFICLLLLAGCKHIPETPAFPSIPPALEQDCDKLSTLPNGAKLSQTMIVVTQNYMKYHDCDLKNQAWKEWYYKQKKIYDSIGK